MNNRIAVLTLAAALTFAMAAPASAKTPAARYHASIAYADLNLDNTAGADAMIDRLRGAARETCGERSGPMTVAEHQRIRACSAAFVQRGVVRLENPAVAQRFIERGGRLPAVTVAST
jgi:UrcA family protein